MIKETRDKYDMVIGIIDSYDAVHYKKIMCDSSSDDMYHETHWPCVKSKRWRFNIREWQLEQSILSETKINKEDSDRIYALMEKICIKPMWMRGYSFDSDTKTWTKE